MAAAIVLMREAGGFVTDADGGAEMMASGSVCCGNEVIHRQLLRLLREAESAGRSPVPRAAQV
jgi:myo-inositol-1(or 4)-monophosphatase